MYVQMGTALVSIFWELASGISCIVKWASASFFILLNQHFGILSFSARESPNVHASTAPAIWSTRRDDHLFGKRSGSPRRCLALPGFGADGPGPPDVTVSRGQEIHFGQRRPGRLRDAAADNRPPPPLAQHLHPFVTKGLSSLLVFTPGTITTVKKSSSLFFSVFLLS